jgi:glyoxylase-like metal-dependent hydrolase (beta-lactamase superfamily II)
VTRPGSRGRYCRLTPADSPDRAPEVRPSPIDLEHLGRPKTIASWRVGDVLIDCGPSSCLERLLAAVGDDPPRALLLTHIHLDHAGAAGTLARLWPELTVYVHERGAPHLASPARLVQSAARLYGDAMEMLWGAIDAVPADRIKPLAGGEHVEGFAVAYTPGHASHHVAYLHDSGAAFVGDAAGVRIHPGDLVVPHAPPPDVDIAAWERTLDVLSAWDPSWLGLPHFGAVDDVVEHIEAARARLRRNAALARDVSEDAFVEQAERDLESVPSDLHPAYRQTAPAQHSYLGLRRFWEKRAA